MKKDTYKTDVIFRRYLDGQIIALFPHEIADFHGNVTSYQHIGQHSGADYSGVLMCTKPCRSKYDFIALYDELTSIGYDLNVIQRRNYSKYLQEYKRVNKG